MNIIKIITCIFSVVYILKACISAFKGDTLQENNDLLWAIVMFLVASL